MPETVIEAENALSQQTSKEFEDSSDIEENIKDFNSKDADFNTKDAENILSPATSDGFQMPFEENPLMPDIVDKAENALSQRTSNEFENDFEMSSPIEENVEDFEYSQRTSEEFNQEYAEKSN